MPLQIDSFLGYALALQSTLSASLLFFAAASPVYPSLFLRYAYLSFPCHCPAVRRYAIATLNHADTATAL